MQGTNIWEHGIHVCMYIHVQSLVTGTCNPNTSGLKCGFPNKNDQKVTLTNNKDGGKFKPALPCSGFLLLAVISWISSLLMQPLSCRHKCSLPTGEQKAQYNITQYNMYQVFNGCRIPCKVSNTHTHTHTWVRTCAHIHTHTAHVCMLVHNLFSHFNHTYTHSYTHTPYSIHHAKIHAHAHVQTHNHTGTKHTHTHPDTRTHTHW